MALPLYLPMTAISFILSRLGGMGVGGELCQECPQGQAARGERGEEFGRDSPAPLVQPPARALLWPRAEQKATK